MNEQQVRGYLNKIIRIYRNFLKAEDDKADILAAWMKALKDVQEEDALQALDTYSVRSKYPPTIADILSCLPVKETEHDPYYGYGSQEELRRVVAATRKAAARIHAWAEGKELQHGN